MAHEGFNWKQQSPLACILFSSQGAANSNNKLSPILPLHSSPPNYPSPRFEIFASSTWTKDERLFSEESSFSNSASNEASRERKVGGQIGAIKIGRNCTGSAGLSPLIYRFNSRGPSYPPPLGRTRASCAPFYKNLSSGKLFRGRRLLRTCPTGC